MAGSDGVEGMAPQEPELVAQVFLPSLAATSIRVVAYLRVGPVDEFSDAPMLGATGWLSKIPLRELVYADRWGQEPRDELVRQLSADAPMGIGPGASSSTEVK